MEQCTPNRNRIWYQSKSILFPDMPSEFSHISLIQISLKFYKSIIIHLIFQKLKIQKMNLEGEKSEGDPNT